MKKIFFILAIIAYCNTSNAEAVSFDPLSIEATIGGDDKKKTAKQRDKVRAKKNKEIAKKRRKAQNKKPKSACKYKG